MKKTSNSSLSKGNLETDLHPSPLFIAEISSNHIQAGEREASLERALATIDAASQIGADAVKFQLFQIDKLFAPEILSKSPLHRARKAWELPPAFIPKLAHHAKAKGLLFSCTPFDLEAAAFIAPYVDFFKIASYELLWHPLLLTCASYGKPVWLSTGMASLDEVKAAVSAYDNLATGAKGSLSLMHCVSSYPTPIEECNLSAIDTIRNETGLAVGWSDHSKSAAAILSAALRYRVSAIEFHLDIEGKGAEFAPGHCWLPNEMADLIKIIRKANQADGLGIKAPGDSERADCEWRADPEDGLRPLKSMRQKFNPA